MIGFHGTPPIRPYAHHHPYYSSSITPCCRENGNNATCASCEFFLLPDHMLLFSEKTERIGTRAFLDRFVYRRRRSWRYFLHEPRTNQSSVMDIGNPNNPCHEPSEKNYMYYYILRVVFIQTHERLLYWARRGRHKEKKCNIGAARAVDGA